MSFDFLFLSPTQLPENARESDFAAQAVCADQAHGRLHGEDPGRLGRLGSGNCRGEAFDESL